MIKVHLKNSYAQHVHVKESYCDLVIPLLPKVPAVNVNCGTSKSVLKEPVAETPSE